jgi:hypothetical protein
MSSDTNPYEALLIVQESAYNTPMTSPVAGTNSIYVRLAGANRFTMRPKPTMRKIKYGGGYDVAGYAVSDQVGTEGDLSLELCYSQAKFVMDWLNTRVSGTGTVPWTTTEPDGDLASCSVYHAVMRSDGTIRRRLYGGVKAKSWGVTINAKDGVAMLKASLRSSGPQSDPTATAFPLPADTVFPTDPILFFHGTGANNLGGSALAYLDGLTLDVTNVMDAKYFQSSNGHLTFDRLRGRAGKIGLDLLYSASPEWRTLYEAITSEAASFAFTNGTHTATFNFQSNVLIDAVEDDLSPGKVYMQKISGEYMWDTSAGDPSFTFA